MKSAPTYTQRLAIALAAMIDAFALNVPELGDECSVLSKALMRYAGPDLPPPIAPTTPEE